ncbi:hypothetical protein [Synechococcus sp. M16CYN]|uniref:hypothetical protein n=1 Tax=Synechococcus sp. M16CYN TaxID=3103139 RepID=UPI0032564916
MTHPKPMLFLGLSLASTALVGWVVVASLAPQTFARGDRAAVDQQINLLLKQPRQQSDLPLEVRRTLLERLLALGRFQEAQLVLQPWQTENPRSFGLALLMADLRRLNGDTLRARRDLTQLLRLYPDHPHVLQLLILVDEKDGKGKQAVRRLQQRFNARTAGKRLELGLLLADVKRQRGLSKAAANLYVQLASESPTEARPWLALALLKQDEGKVAEVQALLQKARLRRFGDGQPDPLIDDLAASWSLRAARMRPTQKSALEAVVDKPQGLH